MKFGLYENEGQEQPHQQQPPLALPPSITILWPFSFDAVELLGSGAFAQVHRIRHRDTGEEFACKVLPKHPDHLPAIMEEVGIMHHLSHEAPPLVPIVRLRGLLTQHPSSTLCLVMDLCRGGTLSHFLQQQPGGRLAEPQAALVLHTLVGALSHCHRRLVVHRDIKPPNVLLLRPSDLSSVRLADFGVSALLQHPCQRLSERVGTPGYVAPEVLARDYSSPADIWSLGVLLFEMLSGTLPFPCALPSSFSDDPWDAIADALDARDDLPLDTPPWPRVSSSAKKLVRGMLCKDPAHRLSLHHISHHPWLQTMLTPPPACKPLAGAAAPPLLPWLV